MALPTYYSSFSFLVAALYCKQSWMNNWLPILACFSILNHSKCNETYKGKCAIQWIDRIIAHKIAARSFFDVWFARRALRGFEAFMHDKSSPWLYSYYGCLLYTVMVYYGIVRRKKSFNWHASMHLVSSIGCMCLYNHRRLHKLKN